MIDHRSPFDYFMLAIVCFLASITKMSSSVLSITALFLGSLLFIRNKEKLGSAIKIFCVLTLLLIPYVSNNIVKSGTLLFPVEKTSLNVEWGRPSLVKLNRQLVTAWARKPGPEF